MKVKKNLRSPIRKPKTIHDGWRIVMPGGTVGSVYYAKKSDVEKDIRDNLFLAHCIPGRVTVTFTPNKHRSKK